MRIYKYPLYFVPEQHVELPIHSEILSVQLQDGKPQLWALVEEEQKTTEKRLICMFNTGEEAKKCFRFLATLQVREGEMAWVAHVFEGFTPKNRKESLTMAEIVALDGCFLS